LKGVCLQSGTRVTIKLDEELKNNKHYEGIVVNSDEPK